jgi:hypothetical protein
MSLDTTTLSTIEKYDGEQRYKYLLKTVVSNDLIWILTDDDGCVMLNTDDEDCVPVWPHEALAKAWATDQWQGCKAQSITLHKWHADWTSGLMDDDLAIVVFPNRDNEGLVVFPDEFDFELKQQANKSR